MLYIFNIDEQLQALLKPDTSRSSTFVTGETYFMQPQFPAENNRVDATACPYWDAIHTEKLTGENIFTFTVPADHADAQYVTEGNLVAFKDLDLDWQLFEIKRITDLHGDGLTRTAYCEHTLYELIDDFIEDVRPTDCSAHFAMTQALSGTRWSVGTVDDLGTNSTNYYYESALSAVQKVASVWGGELQFRVVVTGGIISSRYVDLLVRRGSDTGKQFEYGRHTLEIEREVDLTTVITAAYGRGKGVEVGDGYGRRLDFGAIVWTTPTNPADKPLNQEWVGDPDALAQWGRAGGTRHRFGKFEDQEETDPVVLLQKTWDYLQANKTPRATYRMSVVDLERLSGYAHEKVRLGDTVRGIDRKFQPAFLVSARVIEVVRNILRPEDTKITLGNFAPSLADAALSQQQINQTTRDRQGVWDRANQFNQDGTLNTNWLTDTLVGLTHELQLVDAAVTEAKIATGAITSPKLEDAAVTTAKLANLAVDTTKLADLAVVAGKIADGSITTPKMGDASVTTGKLGDLAVVAGKIASGAVDLTTKVTGLLSNANLAQITDATKIADGLLSSSKLADGAVTNTKLAALAVDAAKLATSAVTATKIANAAVGTAAIANLAVGTAQIADLAVANGKIANAAITNAKIGALAVGTANIQDAAINSAKIGSLAVGTAAIQDSAITNAKIVNLAVDSAKIADAAVTNAKIGSAAVGSAAIANLAVGTAHIADAAIISAKIANAAVGSAAIANLAVGTAQIADAAIVTAKIGDLAVTDAKIDSVTANKLTAGEINTNLIKLLGNSFFYWDGDYLYIIDPSDLNKQIRLSKEGIRITDDGGQTWTVAISVDGMNADAINAGTVKAGLVQIGPDTAYESGYDPSTKETPTAAQAKADAAEQAAMNYAATTNVNLIKNGGAEIYTGKSGTNIPDDWSFWQNYTACIFTRRVSDSEWTINGAASFEIAQGDRTVNGDSTGTYYQVVGSPKIGTNYTLSGILGAHRCDARISLIFLDAVGNWLDSRHITNTTSVLVKGSVTCVCPTGTTQILVELRKGDTNVGETSSFLFADCVKLEEGSVATPYIEYGQESNVIANQAIADLHDHNDDQSPHNLPSYCTMTSDGIKVFDDLAALRVHLGQYATGKYGLKVIDGEIYSTTVRTGSETDTTYVELAPPNIFRAVRLGKKTVEIIPGGFTGQVIVFDNDIESATLTGLYSYNSVSHSGLMSENSYPLILVGPSSNFLTLDTDGRVTADPGSGNNYFHVIGNMSCSGSKPAIHQTETYGQRAMYARESPNLKFIEEFVSHLTNGECRIEFEPMLMETMEPNTEQTPWSILCTPHADIGLYVAEIGDNYIIIRERGGGTSDSCFSWSMSAFRKGFAHLRMEEFDPEEDLLTLNWEDELLQDDPLVIDEAVLESDWEDDLL